MPKTQSIRFNFSSTATHILLQLNGTNLTATYLPLFSIESESEVAQSCPTLCDPMDCSPPGSSLHGILQARVLEGVAISFSRGASPPRDGARVSCIPGRRFNLGATTLQEKTQTKPL